MSETKEQKPKSLYTYHEDLVNLVLQYLSDRPAKEVLQLINSLLRPLKVEPVPSEEAKENQ